MCLRWLSIATKLKELIVLNAVGIDVAKGKSVVSILRPFGEVISSPFELCHTSSAIDDFIHSLSNLEGEVRIVLEYTGRYHEPIARWLYYNIFIGYKVLLIPLVIPFIYHVA